MSPLDISSQPVQINEKWKATTADSRVRYGGEPDSSAVEHHHWPTASQKPPAALQPVGKLLAPAVAALCCRSYTTAATLVVSVQLWTEDLSPSWGGSRGAGSCLARSRRRSG